MIRKIVVVLTCVLLIMEMTGCKQFRRWKRIWSQRKELLQPEETAPVMVVDNLNLAEAVLKPKAVAVNLSRDPFAPFEYHERKRQQEKQDKKETEEVVKIRLVGMASRSGERRVLLGLPSGIEIFKEGDSVLGKFVVCAIGTDRVILMKDDKEILIEMEDRR